MPYIRISVGATSLDENQVRSLQSGTTDLMATVLRKKAALTAVQVLRTEPVTWSVGGESRPISAHVEATITAGTNSAEEKSRFIAEEMSLLRRVLGGDLSEGTYVVLQELSPAAWGYGGMTQEERTRLSQAA